MKYSSLGFESIAVFLLFTALGYFIDKFDIFNYLTKTQNNNTSVTLSHWGLLLGLVLGLIFSFIYLLTRSKEINTDIKNFKILKKTKIENDINSESEKNKLSSEINKLSNKIKSTLKK